jgi:hypothetical protein
MEQELMFQRRRQPAEGEDEAEGQAEGEAAAKPKRKPRNRKPKTQEARIDGGEESGAAAEGGEAKPAKAKKAKKPRQPKLELTGEQSKVCSLLNYLLDQADRLEHCLRRKPPIHRR